MNRAFFETNLAWLDLRIAETQKKILCEKTKLGDLEKAGLNSSSTCRNLAIKTAYLNMLGMRRAALLAKLEVESSDER